MSTYKSLSTANLPDPVIDPAKGVEPRDYFETFLYTGNGGGLQVGDVIKKPADTTTISNSLIFNNDDSAYLSRTHTLGNRKTWTWSGWVKRGNLGTGQRIFHASTDSNNRTEFYFRSDDQIEFFSAVGGVHRANIKTNAKFRDPSAWYHLVVKFDAANTSLVIYINGVSQTLTTTTAVVNTDHMVNSTNVHTLGRYNPTGASYLDGYLAEVHFIDGTALDADYFGNFDANGIWIPKTVTGITYGTNGFYLDFSDNTSTTTLGEDQAGSNDWTLNNFATTDQVSDSPTNNFVTLNPLATSLTLSDGNLKASGGSTHNAAKSTMAISAGMKIYVEVTFGATPDGAWFGLTPRGDNETGYTSTDRTGLYSSSAASTFFGSGAGTNVGGPLLNNGDTWGMAVDFDSGRAWFAEISGGTPTWYARNGSNGSQYAPDGASDNLFEFMNSNTDLPLFVLVAQNSNPTVNFGQKPFAISSVPTGFLALSENNITVDDQNLESPDFVWIKARTDRSHYLFDSVRGVYKALTTNSTAAEATYPDQLQSFNTNGFTIGSLNGVNAAGENYVAWCWKAGTSFSNDASATSIGTVDSNGSVNTTSGFSIVRFNSGASGTQSFKHGLTQRPDLCIFKEKDSGGSGDHWVVWEGVALNPAQSYGYLNLTNAFANDASQWSNTAPTDSIFTYNSGYSFSTSQEMICYCFHSVDGFSRIGSYTGNGSSDGPLVYTGFRVGWLMVKRTDDAFGWYIHDAVRDPFNHTDSELVANSAGAEYSREGAGGGEAFDFVANGFKIRTANTALNASGGTYIYMAFAEQPFKFSNAR